MEHAIRLIEMNQRIDQFLQSGSKWVVHPEHISILLEAFAIEGIQEYSIEQDVNGILIVRVNLPNWQNQKLYNVFENLLFGGI